MKLSYNKCLQVAFAFFLGTCLQLTNGSYNAIQRLEEVIEMAERESKLLANEINQWLVQESGGMLKEDEEMHLRSKRSVDDVDEGAQTDADLLAEVSQPIVRRDIAKDKRHRNKSKSSGVVKIKDEKEEDSSQLLKRLDLDIQTDKHHAKKTSQKKKAEDKEKGRKVLTITKAKRVLRSRNTKAKQKVSVDELSKENLVNALIGGDAHFNAHSGANGVPEKAYRQLVEYFAGSEQSTIQTGSKKSEIAQPEGDHKQTDPKKMVRGKLTKKHERVLAILAKMDPNVLRKYFHLKGFDKYWKLMQSIRKSHFAKPKRNEDKKVTKKVKDSSPKKSKSLPGHVPLAKPVPLHKQAKQQHTEKVLPQHKIVNDKPSQILSKDAKAKKIGKEKTANKLAKHEATKKVAKDEEKENLLKPIIVQGSSSPKLVKHTQKLATVKERAASYINKHSHKAVVEQSKKKLLKSHHDKAKDSPKQVKNEVTVKASGEGKNSVVVKDGGPASIITPDEKDAAALNEAPTKGKPKSPQVQVMPKQEDKKKVGFKPVSLKQTVLSKITKDKPKHGKDLPMHAAEVTSNKMKDSGKQSTMKSPEKHKELASKDQSTHQLEKSKTEPEKHKETLEEKLKAMVPKGSKPSKLLNDKNNSLEEYEKKLTKVSKAVTANDHHDAKATQAEKKPESKNDRTSPVKQTDSGTSKIDILKEKIRKTNNLKFKVAQALLAHCETQNRLRQVFDDVNNSLKKAATMAKAIGAKFGIKARDIEKMTSEHTEGAVEQFLNQLF
ncbi:uncharacterized protein LOC111322783 [Stylophora pistillata]|nr:uncharacterized protein LOC111322783 [Stylophora pistillata]